ncbi:hypothetical protein VNO77_14096 [Canavalia gladiata]|uniref:Uncharacterized protein n=1 Tax=Canavalia gladiata TaxID=3824 RepID=A0AAN9QQU3_CANGL
MVIWISCLPNTHLLTFPNMVHLYLRFGHPSYRQVHFCPDNVLTRDNFKDQRASLERSKKGSRAVYGASTRRFYSRRKNQGRYRHLGLGETIPTFHVSASFNSRLERTPMRTRRTPSRMYAMTLILSKPSMQRVRWSMNHDGDGNEHDPSIWDLARPVFEVTTKSMQIKSELKEMRDPPVDWVGNGKGNLTLGTYVQLIEPRLNT